MKKVGNIVEEEEDEPQTTTSRLDNWINPEDRIQIPTQKVSEFFLF